jgi:hypothetical protein
MMEVHIFPENQRGATEGFRPWDQRPNSTMTNATVAQTVKGTDGQNILVKYKDGEKKVVVPPGTPIVTFVAGDKSELKAGAKVIIFGAVKKDDGTLEANRVNVGRDGITPPPATSPASSGKVPIRSSIGSICCLSLGAWTTCAAITRRLSAATTAWAL